MKKRTATAKGVAKKKLSKLDVQKLRRIRGGSDYVSTGAGCTGSCTGICPTKYVGCPKNVSKNTN